MNLTPNRFQSLFTRRKKPLTGVPAVRRMKTYSAQSGYVYQYFYEGHRPFGGGTEFVFTISADRKSWLPVSVLLADAAISHWEQANCRELSPTERYAVSKMALFQAFDERPAPENMKNDICVRNADVDGIVDTLDL